MNYVKNEKIENKKVIVRLDLNVTIKNNKIMDDTKIIRSLETINYLLKDNNKLIILSHMGKIKCEEDKKNNSLYPVFLKLEKLINTKIYFSNETRGKKLENLINNMKEREIVLVENTRYEDFPNKLESSCDNELSKYWASLADIFVFDAFGTSHRKHASTSGIKKYLPTYYGLLVNEEIENLNELIQNPKKPFTVIMGGAKIDDKLDLIKNLLPKCDNLIVGGGIANTFLKACGNNVGNSLYSEDKIKEVEVIYKDKKNKIVLPNDVVVLNQNKIIIKNISMVNDSDIIYDIGHNSIKYYKKIIDESATIFINGTLGMYEDERFKKGTENLLKMLSTSKAKVFVGGGDAVSAVNNLGFSNTFYFKSTGGGATLEYLIKGKLAALED